MENKHNITEKEFNIRKENVNSDIMSLKKIIHHLGSSKLGGKSAISKCNDILILFENGVYKKTLFENDSSGELEINLLEIQCSLITAKILVSIIIASGLNNESHGDFYLVERSVISADIFEFIKNSKLNIIHSVCLMILKSESKITKDEDRSLDIIIACDFAAKSNTPPFVSRKNNYGLKYEKNKFIGIVFKDRAPSKSDYKDFSVGCFWLIKDTEKMWLLTSKKAGIATWIKLPKLKVSENDYR